MCGIVGVATKGGMTFDLIKVFNDLLFMDTLRGFDSTGVAAIPMQQGDATVYKRALPAPDFLQLRAYNKLVARPSSLRALLGHNRAATRGAVTDDNAHPFEHAGITLVHNGSLTHYSNLVPHNSVDVDSEAICIAIAQATTHEQLVDVIEKISGAFSLVWHDSTTDYLWFVRNEDRPMTLCQILDPKDESKYLGFMWAAEPDMLLWAAARRGLRIGKIWSSEVGRLIAIDLSNECNIAFDERVNTYVKKWYGGGTSTVVGSSRPANTSGQATYGAAQTISGQTSKSSPSTSAGTGQSASQSSAQGSRTKQSGTCSQKTSSQLSLPHKEADRDCLRPRNRDTLIGRKGFSEAPEYGEFIEFRVAPSSYTGYTTKGNVSQAKAGFICGTAVCGKDQLEYPVITHSVPADYKASGVYRGFIIGLGPRTDQVRGEKDADITIYVTFSTCTKVDDTLQEVYQKGASLDHKRSATRPATAALKSLYEREVQLKSDFVKKSRASEEQLTEYALSTPWFTDIYNSTCYLEYDLELVPIGDDPANGDGGEYGPDDMDTPRFAYGPDGEMMSYDEFNKKTKYGCAECTMDLFPENSIDYLWVRAGHEDVCLCDECAGEWLDKTHDAVGDDDSVVH